MSGKVVVNNVSEIEQEKPASKIENIMLCTYVFAVK